MSKFALALVDRLLGSLARACDLRLDADALLVVPPSLLPRLATAAVGNRRTGLAHRR